MDVIYDLDCLPHGLENAVVMIGNFDGLHKGHQYILDQGAAQAAKEGVPLVVLTFHPHPKAYFNTDMPPFRLMKMNDKIAALKARGDVDGVVVFEFNEKMAGLSADRFIDDILVSKLKAKRVMVGRNFIFGYRRGGNIETLEAAAAKGKFDVTAFDLHRDPEDKHFSSTRIRNHLRNGEPEKAAALLGRPWSIKAAVQKGDQKGHAIGTPTANLEMGDYLRPLYGVYAVAVTLEDGTTRNGVANIGVRPTVGGLKELLEVHLFEFDGDLYGQTLRVALHAFLREERKFDGLASLQSQIAKDITAAKKVLG